MGKKPDIWFKRKTYGWGWVPATWQGWAVIAAYIAGIAFFLSTLDERSTGKEIALMFVLPMTLMTAALLSISYKKGETPRWQWGSRDKKDGL